MAGSSQPKSDFPRMGMSDDDFRSAAKDMVDYVIQYYHSTKGRQPYPSVEPGFMKEILPSSAPQRPGLWKDLLADLDEVVMKGMTHWQSSRFFAYFPCATSFPSILADMLCEACACVGFSWAASPSCTELEHTVLDWLAKALGLPDCFVYDGEGSGCGIIQGSASEATFMSLLAARTKALQMLSSQYPDQTQHQLLSKLVAYSSKYAHSSVEKACLIGMVNFHKLPVDENISVRGEALKRAMERDKSDGKIPFFVCATLGTTACTSFDNLHEIGQICNAENVWLHVDAAYAGCSFICPEFRHHMKGIEMVNSFSMNPSKRLMVNYDLSAHWVKNSADLTNSLKIVAPIISQEDEGSAIDYRHWQIPFGRRFRSLKLWFVLRLVGIEGLKQHIREDVRLANMLESFIRTDDRFEVTFPAELGLVCFRLTVHKDDKERNRAVNERLFKKINDSRDIHLNASVVEEIYFIRVVTNSVACDDDAIRNCWDVILKHTTALLEELPE